MTCQLELSLSGQLYDKECNCLFDQSFRSAASDHYLIEIQVRQILAIIYLFSRSTQELSIVCYMNFCSQLQAQILLLGVALQIRTNKFRSSQTHGTGERRSRLIKIITANGIRLLPITSNCIEGVWLSIIGTPPIQC